MRIVEHPQRWSYLLYSDEWREWPLGGPWTIAPLYYLFLAALLAVSGSSLVFVQVVQSAMDAAVAVAVGSLGARAARSPQGRWAGVAYALSWPAIQLCNSTMTEALHTPLLALAFVLLARLVPEDGEPEPLALPRRAFVTGLVFGLGGLARTVGLAFLPVAAALVFLRHRRAWLPPALLIAGALLPIAPWAVRNRVLMGDPNLIESASVANLLVDNVYVEGERYDRLEHFVFKETTPAARRERAMEFVRQGLRKRYDRIPAKVLHNATHLLRPEGLWVLLGVQHPWPAWRHALNLLFDDLWLFAGVPLFLAWLAAGRGWLRAMLFAWTALYLFLIVIVFHAEIRYRMPLLPYALAGAAGGVAVLARGERRRASRIAFGLGALLIAVVCLRPYVVPAWRGVRAFVSLRPEDDPTSTWPWIRSGRRLIREGRAAEALDAYAHAAPLREVPWEPPAVKPALLAALGRADEARAAAAEAHAVSQAVDSWILLEVAWRALDAPVTDEVLLARNDYGAVRDFLIPRLDQRWSRATAHVRLRPRTPAPAYHLVVEMGAPPPAPPGLTAVVEAEGARSPEIAIGRAFAEQRLRIPAPADGVIHVTLHASTWSRSGQPAAQGVAVRRVAVIPIVDAGTR